MKTDRIRIIVNIAIAIAVFGAWLSMFFRGGGFLASAGVRSLRYFTTLSNLLEGVAAAALAVTLIRGKDPAKLGVFKLVATAAVTLTFLVVVLFLGPLYGYPRMFRGANLWFHLIIPLVAIAEFIAFNGAEIPKKKRLWVVISPLVYGTVYLINILMNGAEGNDVYGFTLWGYPVAAVIFAAICAMTYLAGVLLAKANERVRRRKDAEKA